MIVGITGSIGSGKTFVAEIFKMNNARVFDADKEVHSILENALIVETIDNLFGEYTVKNGKVDRAALGKIVFFDEAKKKHLENVIYPPLRQRLQHFIKKAEEDNCPIIVLDVPLLYENDMQSYCDTVVVATANDELLRKRALARPEMTEEKYKAIVSSQMPLREKEVLADFVVDTSRGNNNTILQVDHIISLILKTEKEHEEVV